MKLLDTKEMAIQMVCDGMLRLFALGGQNEIDELAKVHDYILKEWDERIAKNAATALESIMEGIATI